MGKALKIIAVIAILIAVPKSIQKTFGLDEKSQTKKQMEALVSGLKAKLPTPQGQGITLTDVDFDNTSFTLRNTYVVDENADFDPSKKSQFEKASVTLVCEGPQKELSKRGITIEYRYKYKEHGIDSTLNFSVPPNRCA